ncbi:MAG: hypothetical protein CM15mP103_07100 [Gammaproteobacteria bacterium]|nr:MAG: hypothetical protein CM15mP103_07100 [Gammaproteobacteria bacterium]
MDTAPLAEWRLANGGTEGCDAFADDSGTLPATARQQLTQLVSSAGEILAKEGIDCDFHHGGCIMAAAGTRADRASAKTARRFSRSGVRRNDYRWLTPTELSQRIQVANPGGRCSRPRSPHSTGQVGDGAGEGGQVAGGSVFDTPARMSIHSGVIHCDRGSIQAGQIVVATEGYSEAGNPLHRRLIPVQTGMVATEPLSDMQWSGLGFANNETFADCTRAATYLQRTADSRLVIGARGHYQPGGLRNTGSATRGPPASKGTHRSRSFPQLTGVRFTHNWGGSVGVPRDWHPHVIHDTFSGIATAGGYVGEGVGASFLFGQTLAELLTGHATDRTRMPWISRRSLEELKRWEPEPLPQLGLKATMMAFGAEEWLLDRYGEGIPAKAAGWLCDQLDSH